MRQTLLTLLLAAALTGVCIEVAAQGNIGAGAFPWKTIRVLIPFPPGGTPDIQFRMLAEKLMPCTPPCR